VNDPGKCEAFPGDFGAKHRETAKQGQIAPPAELPPEIDEINEKIGEANDAIRSANWSFGDADLAIEQANSLIDDWNAEHPDQQLDPVDRIEDDDLPDERPEIKPADLDPPEDGEDEAEDDEEVVP
jgi:hypothetical protein